MSQTLLILGVIALVAAIAVLSYQARKKRRLAIAAWAQSHGFVFSAERERGIDDYYSELQCLREGQNRYGYNISRGRFGEYGVCAFDYHYQVTTSGSKGQTQTHHHTYSAVIIEPAFPLKPLSLRSERFTDRLAQFFGAEDIDFESAEFNREFHVKAPERRWAFDVLHQESMEFLLQAPRFTIEMRSGYAVAYNAKMFSPEDFDAALGVLTGLVGRVPQSVVRELRGTA
jgi:hypothetical protein